LVLAFFIIPFAGGVDEEDIAVVAVLLENKYASRNACAEEQVGGEPDNSIQQVVCFDDLASYLALLGAAEQYAVGQDYAHAPGGIVQAVQHMADKGVVAFGYGRYTPFKTFPEV